MPRPRTLAFAGGGVVLVACVLSAACVVVLCVLLRPGPAAAPAPRYPAPRDPAQVVPDGEDAQAAAVDAAMQEAAGARQCAGYRRMYTC